LVASGVIACAAAPPGEATGTISAPLIFGIGKDIKLFPTGVDDNGTKLAEEATDPHYTLSSDDPNCPGPAAVTVANLANVKTKWAANPATSQWISCTTDGTGADGGTFRYTTTFELPAGVPPSTVTISGKWGCDDGCTINVNGKPTGVSDQPPPNGDNFKTFSDFSIPTGSPFQAGTNTIEFVVTNVTGNQGFHITTISGTAGCTADTDCGAGNFCNTETQLCMAQIVNGLTVPTIAGHTPNLDGTCTADVGTAVCASGVCDTNDDKCGFNEGDGPCTVENGGTVCRSGVCDEDSSTCAAVVSCGADEDCDASSWCNTAVPVCTPKLANSAAIPVIPNPPGHTPTLDGTCTEDVGAAVCVSGVCDTADTKCGFTNGTGPCDASNANTVCRSGACSTNGTCMAAGGCNVDQDCSGNMWCNQSAHSCTPKVVNGGYMPTDSARTSPVLNGTCSDAAAALTCESGVCDVSDNRCGFGGGTGPCTAENGAKVCRSKQCNDDGKCAAPTTCSVDTDCDQGMWCNGLNAACSPKLDNGSSIPNDPSHTNPTLDGICTTEAAALVCQSGVCDTADNKCGFASGGLCTTDNATTVCRSAQCQADDTCVPISNNNNNNNGSLASGISPGGGGVLSCAVGSGIERRVGIGSVFSFMAIAIAGLLRRRRDRA